MGVALKRQNHEVIEAGGVRRALSAAARHGGKVDLLISELSLPRMSALDLRHELRKDHPDMAALFVSRNPHPPRLEETVRAGGGTVLREPFEMTTLLGEVARLLDLPDAARIPPASSKSSKKQTRAAANGQIPD